MRPASDYSSVDSHSELDLEKTSPLCSKRRRSCAPPLGVVADSDRWRGAKRFVEKTRCKEHSTWDSLSSWCNRASKLREEEKCISKTRDIGIVMTRKNSRKINLLLQSQIWVPWHANHKEKSVMPGFGDYMRDAFLINFFLIQLTKSLKHWIWISPNLQEIGSKLFENSSEKTKTST